jgi:DNA-binding transcriptional MocR family regulator
VAPERVLVSSGAHAGLYLALQTLCRPGDAVLVEQLAYPGLADILRVLHLRPEPLPLDAEGLVPEALAEACRHGGQRVLVLTPNLHNPTTATLGQARREAIAEIARRHELMLLEDDVYGPLLAERRPTLASLAPERTIHIASISKAVVPGLRLGSLVAPPRLVEALASGLHALRIAEPPLMAELFRRWLVAGLIERATLAQRDELAARRELAAALLAGSGASLTMGPGAPHLWLGLPPPWRGGELGDALMRQGIHVAAGELFTSGRAATPAAIRISLGGAADQARLGAALGAIRDTIAAGPPARPTVI